MHSLRDYWGHDIGTLTWSESSGLKKEKKVKGRAHRSLKEIDKSTAETVMQKVRPK